MFLDREWRPEGEPPERPRRSVSNVKIALILGLVPIYVFCGMIGFAAIGIGYNLLGCISIGIAILSLQQFVIHGVDVLFSIHTRDKEKN